MVGFLAQPQYACWPLILCLFLSPSSAIHLSILLFHALFLFYIENEVMIQILSTCIIIRKYPSRYGRVELLVLCVCAWSKPHCSFHFITFQSLCFSLQSVANWSMVCADFLRTLKKTDFLIRYSLSTHTRTLLSIIYLSIAFV